MREAHTLFEQLRQWAQAFIASSFIYPSSGPQPAFDPPLLGVADGGDAMWRQFQDPQVVGPFHWTPEQAYRLAFPGEEISAHDLRVLCWILPQTAATMADQRTENELPSERWAYSRMLGETVANSGLRKFLVEKLEQLGYPSFAPLLLPQWRQMTAEPHSPSTWSERHAAHAAGLGTFGLSEGLITVRGKAHRVGSLVTKCPLPITPRTYTTYNEHCLFFNGSGCGACIKRCPAGAISPQGHDKIACSNYLFGVTSPYVQNSWHIENGYGCGLCQSDVPCAERQPLAAK